MIQPQDVSIQVISNILHSAAIDHLIEPDGDIYVTDLAFNFWINLDPEKSRLNLRTYWDFLPGIAEIDTLRCANACNASLVSLQFYAEMSAHCLRATQAIPFGDGIIRVAFLRALRVFAEVFKTAISEPSRAQLFVPVEEPWDCEEDGNFVPRRQMLN